MPRRGDSDWHQVGASWSSVIICPTNSIVDVNARRSRSPRNRYDDHLGALNLPVNSTFPDFTSCMSLRPIVGEFKLVRLCHSAHDEAYLDAGRE